jgi:hypothetical protein
MNRLHFDAVLAACVSGGTNMWGSPKRINPAKLNTWRG